MGDAICIKRARIPLSMRKQLTLETDINYSTYLLELKHITGQPVAEPAKV